MSIAYLIAGLGYGDEGKGATVDFLARETGAKIVVRYNGGAQAGHNVVRFLDGRHHTFSQFGSGTFVPGVKTFLSKYMMVNPMAMMREEEHLQEVGIDDAWVRTTVDPRALIITPFQKAVNVALMKASGKNNSCGMGIGQTREDHIKYGNMVVLATDLDYGPRKELRRKLQFIQDISIKKVEGLGDIPDVLMRRDAIDWCMEEYEKWPAFIGAISYRPEDSLIFEGAQGALLDEKHGEEGFNTWTNTTFDNCWKIMDETFPSWGGNIVRIGVLRTYATRHGDGPFQDSEKMAKKLPELHNENVGAQGKFRKGLWAISDILKARDIVGWVDGVALNHMDEEESEFIEAVLAQAKMPVLIEGRGPTCLDRKFTEAWHVKVWKSLYNKSEAVH
jgi:adenylosuccinate synthase